MLDFFRDVELSSKLICRKSQSVVLFNIKAPILSDSFGLQLQLSLHARVYFSGHDLFGSWLSLIEIDFEIDVNGLLLFVVVSLDFWRLKVHNLVQKLLVIRILPHG